MNGYFKPLRRKIGVFTLVLACVWTAAWVRSYLCEDQVEVLGRTFLSTQGGFAELKHMQTVIAAGVPYPLFKPLWAIPHGLVAIPLTLLSAWLLFGKPRAGKTEPS